MKLSGIQETDEIAYIRLIFLMIINAGFITLVVINPFFAGLFFLPLLLLLLLSKYGPIVFFSLILPMTVLTNFIDAETGNVSFLKYIRPAYFLLFLLPYPIYGLFKKDYFRVHKNLRYYFFFLFSLIVPVFFSSDIPRSVFFFVKTYLFPAAVLIFGINLLKENIGRRIFEYFTLVVVLTVLAFASYQYATQSLGFGTGLRNINAVNDLTSLSTMKIPSFFGTSYITAEFYYLLLPFVIAFFLSENGLKRKGLLLLITGMFIGIIWTQQRSGFVISIIVVIAMSLLSKKDIQFLKILKRLLVVLFTGSMLILAIIATDYGYALLVRIQESFTLSPGDISDAGSTVVRLLRIEIAWEIFKKNPLFGSGLGTSPLVYPEYGWPFTDYDGGAHNLYLYLLSESGILGLIGFVAFLTHLFRKSYEKYKHSTNSNDRNIYAASLTFVIALSLDGIFSGVLINPSIIFLVLALSYVYSLMQSKPAYACLSENSPICII